MSDKKKKIGFTVACVNEFAQHHNLSIQEAFRYLFQFKGIAFIIYYALFSMWGVRVFLTFLCVHVFHLGLYAVWGCLIANNVCMGSL